MNFSTKVYLMPFCESCGHTILDKYVLTIGTKCWHESCAVCNVCSIPLTDKCYEFTADKTYILCYQDFIKKRLETQCQGCQGVIHQSDLVIKLQLDLIFHYSCFKCSNCGSALRSGDQYFFTDRNKVVCTSFCRQSFVSTMHHMFNSSNSLDSSLGNLLMFPQTDNEMNSLNSLEEKIFNSTTNSKIEDSYIMKQSGNSDLRCGPYSDFTTSFLNSLNGNLCPGGGLKRPRTILNPSQRRKFKSAFDSNPKPSRKLRENLANETGLSVRVVQVWFQNQRAKEKKVKKKTSHRSKASNTQSIKSSNDNKSYTDMDESVKDLDELDGANDDVNDTYDGCQEPFQSLSPSSKATSSQSSGLPQPESGDNLPDLSTVFFPQTRPGNDYSQSPSPQIYPYLYFSKTHCQTPLHF